MTIFANDSKQNSEGILMRVPVAGDGPTFATYEEVLRGLFCRELAQYTPDEMLKGNILEDVVFQLHGAQHRERRRVENPLFRRETVVHFLQQRFPEILERTLGAILDSGERDVIRIGQMLTVVLSAEISGVDVPAGDLEAIQRLVDLERVFAEGTGIMDTTYDRGELLRMVRDAFQSFDREFFAGSVARRKELIASDAMPHEGGDLLSVLLMSQGQLEMDYALLMRETAFFLESGSDTSSRTLANTLNHLFEWRNAHPDRWNAICASGAVLDFLERCIHEALRLNPIVPVARRIATEDIVLNGVDVEEGTVVYLDAMAANRDPNVFGSNADTFDPERTLPQGIQGFGHGFSGGMHACIGRVLAIGAPATSSGGPKLYGQTTLMLHALVERGVKKDPLRKPVQDVSSHWSRIGIFPVTFTDDLADSAAPNGPHVSVDESRCFGSGDCELLMPDIFHVGKEGVAEVDAASLSRIDDSSIANVQARCPSGAIHLTET